MGRKFMIMLLIGALCLLATIPVLAQKVYTTLSEYEKLTGKKIEIFHEAPMLRVKVAAGELPPVEERLPEEPMVIEPYEEIGQYGGTWHRAWMGRADSPAAARIVEERLVRFTRDLKKIIPNVAESWEISEDGKIFTFHLRRGMKWSDGYPFTADDIMFSYEDILLNDELTPAKPAWLRIGGKLGKLEKLDEYTIRFRFAQPYGLFLKIVASSFGPGMSLFQPKHYLKNFHPRYVPIKKLEEMTKEEGFEFWYQLFQAKSDKFMNPDLPVISAWKAKNSATATLFIMERNPYFWKLDPEGNQLPYIDRVTHSLVESVEMINFKAMTGEIDMQARHILHENYPVLMEGREKGNYRVTKYLDEFETNMAICLNLNHKDPILRKIIQDKRFRIALSLAINRDEINELCYLNMCEEPRQVAPLPQSPYYTKWAKKLAYEYVEYDPKKANELLDEMGLKWDKDHKYRLRPDGKTLSLTFEFTPAWGPWTDAIGLIKEYWEAIGVKTAIKSEERSLLYKRFPAAEHDVTCWTGHAGIQTIIDPAYYLPFNPNASKWCVKYADWYWSGGKGGEEPTGDLRKCIDLYERIKTTMDEEEQLRLWDEIMRLNAENLWVIGTLSCPPLLGVVKNNFRNVPERGIYSFIVNSPANFDPEQFFIKKK